MVDVHLDSEFADTDDVAQHIVGEFAAENSGVAEVIPAAEIQQRLDDVVVNAEELDDGTWESFFVDVKDAVLAQDVVIA
jgi:hypothetical protein